MTLIPPKAPCADARWWRKCTGSTWSDDPCGRGVLTSRLSIGMELGGNFDGVAEFSMVNGYAKGRWSSTTCSSSGWIRYKSSAWRIAIVDVWGAYDAGDWSSSLVITMKMSNPVVRTITPFAQIEGNADLALCGGVGRIEGTPLTTVTTVASSCSVNPDTTFYVTVYDDGSFTVS